MHHIRLAANLLLAVAVSSPAFAQRLIGIDSSRILYDIDMNTGAKTTIGTVSSNAGTTAGLAYDAATGTMYLTSTGNDSLYTLDLTTLTATLVGSYGSSAFVMHGLEFDSSTNTLYGVSSHDNGLYTIDKTTGLATLVGTSGLTSFSNLVYDSAHDVMYSTNSGVDSFYTMDRATGLTTLIGTLNGPTNPNGLAYDTVNDRIFLICNNTDTLYTVDRATGAANPIGAYGSSNLLGLAYVPNNTRIVRNPHGCGQTTISTTGNPSLGGTVTTSLGSVAGFPFLGFGFAVGPVPFCTCTLGHDWMLAMFGTNSVLNLPLDPAFTGVQFGIQGADLNGIGGCVAPQLTLTDTMVVTIG